MSYKCLECGNIFDEGEQAEWEETHGLDYPPYEKWSGCPICKGGYEETEKCRICGGEFLNDELEADCCEECIKELKQKYKYDIGFCVKLAERENIKEDIKINGFLASVFDEQEINKILWQALMCKCAENPVETTPFIEDDLGWFIDKVIEGVTK